MLKSSYGLRQGQGSMECCEGRQGVGGCWMLAGHAPPVSLKCTVMEKIKKPYITGWQRNITRVFLQYKVSLRE